MINTYNALMALGFTTIVNAIVTIGIIVYLWRRG